MRVPHPAFGWRGGDFPRHHQKTASVRRRRQHRWKKGGSHRLIDLSKQSGRARGLAELRLPKGEVRNQKGGVRLQAYMFPLSLAVAL